MQETKKKPKNLIEFMGRSSLAENPVNRHQLIRILSRSSNLPKVQSINILALTDHPNSFEIEPGNALKIGTEILNNPVVALLYIRYGLEWQIWYRSFPTDQVNPLVCDYAASQVAAKFYDTLSLDDKKELIGFPEKYFNIFRKFKTEEELPTLSKEDIWELGSLHGLPYQTEQLSSQEHAIITNLAYPLEYLLMSGGDKRLLIDRKHLLNKYGCTPFPRPKAYTFASSTATSISNIAFNQAEKKREDLISDCLKSDYESTLKEYSEEIKSRLSKALDLPKDTSIILAPSGTDVSLLFAGLCQSLFDKKLVHVLVGSDETGSGVPAAIEGKHFSDRTSQDIKVTKGEMIKGFEEVELYPIQLRNSQGNLKSAQEIDEEVINAYKKIMQEGKQPILHGMNQSKLGYVAPSKTCLNHLENEYGKDFFALIDNSQMRMGRMELGNYIQNNYAMTITGSKFFTGPPFCGALIMPASRESLLGSSEGSIPEGLIDYVHKNNFPPYWKSVQKLKNGSNLGTLMRWYAAIIEQERYFDTPVLLRNLGTEMFATHVENAIRQSGFLEGLFKDEMEEGKTNSIAATSRSIFPFFVLKDGKVLTHSEITKVYHLLNQKLSSVFPDEVFENGFLGDQVCHIGQPVKAIYKDGTLSGVVRISIGSRVISESWKEQDVGLFFHKIEDQINQVETIIRKIDLILQNPGWWKD